MRIGVNSVPAPGWLRELNEAKSAYQELFGWPVSVAVGARNLVVALGRVVDAVSMPASLGARVLEHLTSPVPVVANSAGTRWTFFAKPAAPIVADLSEVDLAPAGSYAVIPPAMGDWVESPLPNQALPSTDAVVDAARLGLVSGIGCPALRQERRTRAA